MQINRRTTATIIIIIIIINIWALIVRLCLGIFNIWTHWKFTIPMSTLTSKKFFYSGISRSIKRVTCPKSESLSWQSWDPLTETETLGLCPVVMGCGLPYLPVFCMCLCVHYHSKISITYPLGARYCSGCKDMIGIPPEKYKQCRKSRKYCRKNTRS